MVAQGKPVPVIETRRLRLRGFTNDDLDALAAIYADPDVIATCLAASLCRERGRLRVSGG